MPLTPSLGDGEIWRRLMAKFLKRVLWWLRSRAVFFLSSLLLFTGALLVAFVALERFPQSQSFTSLPLWIAATSTFFAAISSIASLTQAVEAQRQRESMERPYVIAYFEGDSRGAVFFVIENQGNSPAFNVEIKFEGPAPVDVAGRPLNTISLFQKPISLLSPGKAQRQFIDVGHRLLAEGKLTQYKVKVTYWSAFGRDFGETFEYDLAYLKQATVPSKTIEENLAEIAAHLKEIEGLLKSVRGINSLLVETPEQFNERIAKIDS